MESSEVEEELAEATPEEKEELVAELSEIQTEMAGLDAEELESIAKPSCCTRFIKTLTCKKSKMKERQAAAKAELANRAGTEATGADAPAADADADKPVLSVEPESTTLAAAAPSAEDATEQFLAQLAAKVGITDD